MKRYKDNITITHPELVKEWNYELNGELRPENFSYGSNVKVWWKCKKSFDNHLYHDHIWQATISDRTRPDKTDCPCCNGKKVVKSNCLLTTHPELCKEWNYELNGNLKPENFTKGNHKKVWWKCDVADDHVWTTSISNRACYNKTKCPYCQGDKSSKLNNLKVTHPELCKEWNYELNGELKPEQFTYGSNKIIWWICPNSIKKGIFDHVYMSSIKERASHDKVGCSCCRGLTVVKSNSLSTTHPELCKEWNYELNGDLRPENVIAGSNKKVWWKCINSIEKGIFDHVYKSVINSRAGVGQTGCPCCSGHKLVISNSLLTLHPKLCEEWNYELNRELTPEHFTSCCSTKVWWICPNSIKKGIFDHVYKSSISNRTNVNEAGCPCCEGLKVVKSNCLLTTHPELCKEWNYELNGNLKPEHVTYGSDKKVWWTCEKKHIWETTIGCRTRINKSSNCPHCNQSKMEKEAQIFFTNNEMPHIREYKFNNCRNVRMLSFDYYLNEHNICVECQGMQHYEPNIFFGGINGFNKQQINDKIKSDYCKNNNIELITIKYTESVTDVLTKRFL